MIRSAVGNFVALRTWQNDRSAYLTAIRLWQKTQNYLLESPMYNNFILSLLFRDKFYTSTNIKWLLFCSVMRAICVAKIGWFFDGENVNEEEHMKRINLICYKSKGDHSFSVQYAFFLLLFFLHKVCFRGIWLSSLSRRFHIPVHCALNLSSHFGIFCWKINMIQ